MLIECNICHRDFNHTGSTVKKIGKYQVGFFKCPHCGYEYLSYVKDKQVVRMQNEIKDFEKKIQSTVRKNSPIDKKLSKIESLQTKIEHLKYKVANRMDMLKEEYLELQTNGT